MENRASGLAQLATSPEEEVVRLRNEIDRINENAEWNAYSVRQLIAQRARLFEILSLIAAGANFVDGGNLQAVLEALQRSEAQFYQDIFCLLLNRGKRDGFFVEFGAADGKTISNTYLMEKEFGWTGILAEPDSYWHGALKENRSCFIDQRCVWNKSAEKISFFHVDSNPLESSADGGGKACPTYDVETISLRDLLNEGRAPKHIDFLSVDVEGSELTILVDFPFEEYSFGFICVEHRHLGEHLEREMTALLARNGYRQVLRSASGYDGFYVAANCQKLVNDLDASMQPSLNI